MKIHPGRVVSRALLFVFLTGWLTVAVFTAKGFMALG